LLLSLPQTPHFQILFVYFLTYNFPVSSQCISTLCLSVFSTFLFFPHYIQKTCVDKTDIRALAPSQDLHTFSKAYLRGREKRAKAERRDG